MSLLWTHSGDMVGAGAGLARCSAAAVGRIGGSGPSRVGPFEVGAARRVHGANRNAPERSVGRAGRRGGKSAVRRFRSGWAPASHVRCNTENGGDVLGGRGCAPLLDEGAPPASVKTALTRLATLVVAHSPVWVALCFSPVWAPCLSAFLAAARRRRVQGGRITNMLPSA